MQPQLNEREVMKRLSRKIVVVHGLFIVLIAAASNVFCQEPADVVPTTYVIDLRPVAKTPKHLGVNVEVMPYADRANLWDWLVDSGASMVRVGHPDTNLRNAIPAEQTGYHAVRSRSEFDDFRVRLLADPSRNLPWAQYRFEEEIPWLGTPDKIVGKLKQIGIEPIISMAYAPDYFERPLLLVWDDLAVPPDASIDWGAAASAYEYYMACIWRYASRFGVTHYMMLNEPPAEEKIIRQVGVLARMARMALEDVRARLTEPETAAALCLSGPAVYRAWEEYWPQVEPYVDFLDLHLYEPDGDLFARKLARALTSARFSGKQTMITEFNRVGAAMLPEDSLFGVRASLQVASLMMAALTASNPGDPGLEAALFYEFQFPATHRNYKSMVYGDMNLVDWTGRDRALWANKAATPSFESLQLRFATPAYHMLKMATRCVPGTRSTRSSYEVFEMGEANRGVSGVREPVSRRNIYSTLELNKYYALGGGGTMVRTFAVRTEDRLIVSILNPEPVTVKAIGFDVGRLQEGYKTAVVRETSLVRRDEVVAQLPVADGKVVLDIPLESFIQLIFVKEDLSKIEELKIEETTATPGDSRSLGIHETTRLQARGRIGERWLDLSDLNVTWSGSPKPLVNVYGGGLVQRIGALDGDASVVAEVPGGLKARHPLHAQTAKEQNVPNK